MPERARIIEALLAPVLFAFATLLFLRPIWDIDIFWHLAAGRWIREHGVLPSTDIFGFDAERPWVPFQWGYEVAVSWLFDRGGFLAVRLVHTAALCLAFLSLYRTYRRALGPAAAVALWALTLLLYQDRINVRPDVFNLVGLSILLPWLLGGWRRLPVARRGWTTDERRAVIRLIATSAAMMAWAAIHAGGCLNHVIAAVAIPAGVAVSHIGRRHDGDSSSVAGEGVKASAFWLALTLPCLLVPNFITGSLNALLLVQTTGGVIGEWSPPIAYVFGSDPQPVGRMVTGLLPYAALIGLLIMALGRRLREVPLAELGVSVAFIGLSLLFARFVYFVAPAALVLWVALGANAPSRRLDWRVAMTVACVIFAMVWQTNVTSLYGGFSGLTNATRAPIDTRRFPVAAADFLEATGFRGRVYAHARYGSYLLFRLHPSVTTLIDGRLNVPSSVAEAIEYAHAHKHDQGQSIEIATRIAAIYDAFDADALVVETPGFGPGLPDCNTWVQVFRTPKEEVWFRPEVARALHVPIIACGQNAATAYIHDQQRLLTHSASAFASP